MTRFAFIASAVFLATPAFAEVSDKVLSIPGMWFQAVIIGLVAILVGVAIRNGRRRRRQSA